MNIYLGTLVGIFAVLLLTELVRRVVGAIPYFGKTTRSKNIELILRSFLNLSFMFTVVFKVVTIMGNVWFNTLFQYSVGITFGFVAAIIAYSVYLVNNK